MLPEDVNYWTATHPEWEGPVSAYAIDDGERPILIDPIAVPDDVRALFASREVITVLTSTWHERDAASLGFHVWAPAPDRPEDQLVPATRYAIGDSLFGMEAFPAVKASSTSCYGTSGFVRSSPAIRWSTWATGWRFPQVGCRKASQSSRSRRGLRPLLDKPVEFVLPTHGDPADRAALERALA